MVKMRNVYKVFIGKPVGTKQFVRPSRRWENNIKMYLKEIIWGSVDWMHLARDRDQGWALVNMFMNLRVP
jgi:hypothetical protein